MNHKDTTVLQITGSAMQLREPDSKNVFGLLWILAKHMERFLKIILRGEKSI